MSNWTPLDLDDLDVELLLELLDERIEGMRSGDISGSSHTETDVIVLRNQIADWRDSE